MKLQKYKRDSEVSYALGATLVAELLKTHPNAITRVFLRPADKYGDDLTKILDELKARKFEIIESTKAFNILGAKDTGLDAIGVAWGYGTIESMDSAGPAGIARNMDELYRMITA